MINVSNLWFRYVNEEILKDINLVWNKNESLYIWGPNGAGKTTLAYILTNLLAPTKGEITRGDLKETDVLLLMQNPSDMIFTNSVITELAFGPENLGLPRDEIKRRVYWACTTFNLERIAMEPPYNLSGGETLLVVLASLMVMYPKFLILDEPFAHLDWTSRQIVIKAIENLREKFELSTLELGLTEKSGLSYNRCFYLDRAFVTPPSKVSFDQSFIEFPNTGDIIAKLSDVSYTYRGKITKAIFEANLTIHEGEAIGIVGPNGAGKTTLGKLIAGILQPTQGKIKVKGKAGYLFQFPERQFFKEKVIDDVAAGPIALGFDNPIESAKNALNLVGVSELEWERSPFKINTGKLRRIAFASLVAIDPTLFILDEPFADLDENAKLEMVEILRKLIKQGKSYIILSCNLSSIIGVVNRIIIIKGGNIIWDGKISELPYSHKAIRDLGIVI